MFLPAVHHYGPSIWWVEELDLSNEAQQSGGVAGNTMVRPAGEVKLTEFTDLMMTLLKKHTARDVSPIKLHISQWHFQEKILSLHEM